MQWGAPVNLKQYTKSRGKMNSVNPVVPILNVGLHTYRNLA